jgi:hypothetical protein
MTDEWLKPTKPKEEDSIAVQMLRNSMQEWEELAADKNYEICTTFPYPIRTKLASLNMTLQMGNTEFTASAGECITNTG